MSVVLVCSSVNQPIYLCTIWVQLAIEDSKRVKGKKKEKEIKETPLETLELQSIESSQRCAEWQSILSGIT